jgi:hypothetical protein
MLELTKWITSKEGGEVEVEVGLWDHFLCNCTGSEEGRCGEEANYFGFEFCRSSLVFDLVGLVGEEFSNFCISYSDGVSGGVDSAGNVGRYDLTN